MDIDSPVEPIDPRDDRRRVEQAHAARRRSGVRMLLTLMHPLATLAGGFMLGHLLAQAPLVGAMGMLLAWVGARAALFAAASVALALEAPSLARRVFGRAEDARREPRIFQRSAKPVLAVHVLAFAGLAAVAGVVVGLMGSGGVEAPDVVAFAMLGLVLGIATAWTEPA